MTPKTNSSDCAKKSNSSAKPSPSAAPHPFRDSSLMTPQTLQLSSTTTNSFQIWHASLTARSRKNTFVGSTTSSTRQPGNDSAKMMPWSNESKKKNFSAFVTAARKESGHKNTSSLRRKS